MAAPSPLARRLAELTLELCRIASPIHHEGPLADHVEAWALRHFPRPQVYRLNHTLLLGTLDDPRPTVALVGHLDTVPAHPDDKDRQPRLDWDALAGPRVYGLGASDMKGGLAVMLALAEDLERAALPVNVAWLLYEKEEGSYKESGLEPFFEKRPDIKQVRFAVAMEPTDGEVQVGAVGTLHASLTFRGRAAHSARPWQGENAIHKAGTLLADLAARGRTEVSVGGFPFFEVMSVTVARGGRARNVIPESFEVNLNYRFAPGKSLERAQADVLEFVAGRAEVRFDDLSPSGRVCADNPL